MIDDPRLESLLDELFDSDATPEEVCKSCPELLSVVRIEWRRVRHLRADLDVLLPPSDDLPPPDDASDPLEGTHLPLVPGYEVEAVLGRGGMGIVYCAPGIYAPQSPGRSEKC